MSKQWQHRILLVTSVICFITSTLVPAVAPVLGPTGAKVLAIAGAVGLAAANVRTALKGAQKEPEES